MELFLPSLFIIALATIIVFLVLPRFTPLVTITICSSFLTLAVYSHFKMYSNEYKNLMFFDSLKDNWMFLFGIILLGLFLASSTLFKDFNFKIPKIMFSNNTKSSTFKDAMSMPFDKIKDLERQV